MQNPERDDLPFNMSGFDRAVEKYIQLLEGRERKKIMEWKKNAQGCSDLQYNGELDIEQKQVLYF